MKKEYLTVPKNQDILELIADMDSKKLSSKLFIHKDLLEELIKSCSEYEPLGSKIHKLIWDATDVYCKRSITVSDDNGNEWKSITEIDIFRVEYNPSDDSKTQYYIS